jgi:hypothetical protein
MKRPGKTYVPCAALVLIVAAVLVVGVHGSRQVAAQQAAPTDQGMQPAPTAVQAACAALEPAPLLPPDEESGVREAAQEALDSYNSKRPGSAPLEIMSVWGQDGWAVVECVRSLEGRPVSGTEGTLMLASRSAGRWEAALPGDGSYSSWLDRVPDCYLAPATKEEARQLNLAASELIEPSIGIYRLPYPDGAEVVITQDSDEHDGPIDMWSDNGSVVAAMSGWVNSVNDEHAECCCSIQCNPCTNWVKLSHPNGETTEYLHIAQNSVTVTVGQWVEAGTVIAIQSDIGHSCGGGRLETGCGTYHGTTHCGTHVHFAVKAAGVFVKPRICDGQGGWFYPEYPLHYVAASCPGNCCCSSLKSASGSTQPDWGFSPVEMVESPAPTPIPIDRQPVEPRTPPGSEHYRIPKSVFGAGGGVKSSTSFVMNSTQGQSTDLNRRQSTSYALAPGYWGRWTPLIYDHLVYLPLAVKQ